MLVYEIDFKFILNIKINLVKHNCFDFKKGNSYFRLNSNSIFFEL